MEGVSRLVDELMQLLQPRQPAPHDRTPPSVERAKSEAKSEANSEVESRLSLSIRAQTLNASFAPLNPFATCLQGSVALLGASYVEGESSALAAAEWLWDRCMGLLKLADHGLTLAQLRQQLMYVAHAALSSRSHTQTEALLRLLIDTSRSADTRLLEAALVGAGRANCTMTVRAHTSLCLHRPELLGFDVIHPHPCLS